MDELLNLPMAELVDPLQEKFPNFEELKIAELVLGRRIT